MKLRWKRSRQRRAFSVSHDMSPKTHYHITSVCSFVRCVCIRMHITCIHSRWREKRTHPIMNTRRRWRTFKCDQMAAPLRAHFRVCRRTVCGAKSPSSSMCGRNLISVSLAMEEWSLQWCSCIISMCSHLVDTTRVCCTIQLLFTLRFDYNAINTIAIH